MGLGGRGVAVEEYVCQLPEASKKIALEELGEDDAIREQSLEQMREWIDKNGSITNCRTERPFPPETIAKVKEFYERDDVSVMMPGQKDTKSVKIDGERCALQKRLIFGNLRDVYNQFKREHGQIQISFSKFCSLRPEHCIFAGSGGTHNVCLCPIHENMRLMTSDAPFLLRFLRTKKYSVPLACEMLERYLIVRQLHPNWFRNLDCENAEIADIIDAGYLVPLPERDNGRMVIFSCAGRFDPHKYTAAQMIKVHSIVTETLMDDAMNQVNGYTYVNDEAGLQMAHVSLFSLTDIRNVIKCIQHSSPMRHKQNHFLNISPSAIKLIEFSMTFLNEKLKNRVQLHKSYEDLYKQVDRKILPKEYGGEVPLGEMLEKFKSKLRERRAVLLALDEMHIEIAEKHKPFVSEISEELGLGVEGTFKKLQVD